MSNYRPEKGYQSLPAKVKKMGRRIIFECDLCGQPIGPDHVERSEGYAKLLRNLLGDQNLDLCCTDCLERSRKILNELFHQPEELTFKTFVKEIFS